MTGYYRILSFVKRHATALRLHSNRRFQRQIATPGTECIRRNNEEKKDFIERGFYTGGLAKVTVSLPFKIGIYAD